MSEYVQIATTTDEREQAVKIAADLVQRRLAACVQISGPIHSCYRWQGKVETSDEWLCVAKTRRDLFQEVERAIRAQHPYDVPEILATPVIDGSPDYLRWVDEQLGSNAMGG